MMYYFKDKEYIGFEELSKRSKIVLIPKKLIINEYNNFKIKPVVDRMVAHNRWSITHQIIFKWNKRLYSTTYDFGSTESQDEMPFEYFEKNEGIPCIEVIKRNIDKEEFIPIR